MAKLFKNLSVRLKLFLSIVVGIIITVFVVSLFSIRTSRIEIYNTIENSLVLEVKTIQKMFEREKTLKLDKVRTNLKVAHDHFYENELQILNEKLIIEVTNQISLTKHKAKLSKWMHGEKELHSDFSFVDNTYNLLGGTITIFQKSDSGYVRISTNVPNLDGSRAVQTFIPNDSPVIKTIEDGETFYGRAYVVNDWYITAYEPIILNGKTEGMLYVGDKEKDLTDLRKILTKFSFGNSGYVFVFDNEKKMIIHPDMNNKGIESSVFLQRILEEKSGIIKFYDKIKDRNHIAAFEYFSDFKFYVVATMDLNSEVAGLIRKIIINALLVGIVMIIVFAVFVYLVTTENIHKFLKQLEMSNKKLASAQLELEKSEKQFKTLFNNSGDEIFVLDLNGYILELNQVACDNLGYTKKELIGKHFRNLKSNNYIHSVEGNLQIINNKGSHQYESEHITKDGRVIPVEMKSRIIDFYDKRSILTITRDLTDRKQVEEKILTTIISTEEKERKRFAADLHDDLAPILSTIKLYTDLLKKEDLKNINKGDAIRNIDELVDMSLRTTKEISNNIRPNILQDFGLASAVNEFCNYLKESKKINIILSTDKYKIQERGIVESILYQAVKELINNTLKHSNATQINIDLKSFDKQIILYYRDNGKGFNITEATSSKSGLGLYNILNKVKTINGTCDMHSEENKGMFILISIKTKGNN